MPTDQDTAISALNTLLDTWSDLPLYHDPRFPLLSHLFLAKEAEESDRA